MNVGDVIREARKRLRWSQIRLGKEVGVTRQSVSAWEKGEAFPSRENAPALAEKLSIPLAAISADPAQLNVEYFQSGTILTKRVPMLTWVEAGRGAEVVQSYAADNTHEFAEASFPVSKDSFALRVKGSSMEPEFRDGDVIIVDPTQSPSVGDFVVAELLPRGIEPGQGDPMLKEYRPRGRDNGGPAFDLVPLNSEYPTVTVNKANPGRIIGMVVESHRSHQRR